MYTAKRIVVVCLALAALGLAGSSPAAERPFPTKPITLVVPYPPGGPTDTLGRLIASRLGTRLGETVIVINRGGAGGTIGSASVARATPDGYTILFASSDHSTNPIAYPNIPYDTEKAFAPIALLATSTLVLITNNDFPVHSIADLVAYGRANPGKINYATSTIGGNTHLAAELFSQMSGVKMTQVPYQGGASAMTDLLAGRVQVMFSAIGLALPMVQANRVRALGITTAKPTASAPQLKPIAGTLQGFDVGAWYGLLAPAKTPAAVIDRINKEVNVIIHEPDTSERMIKLGADPAGGTAASFQEFIHKDLAKWAGIAKRANFVSPQAGTK